MLEKERRYEKREIGYTEKEKGERDIECMCVSYFTSTFNFLNHYWIFKIESTFWININISYSIGNFLTMLKVILIGKNWLTLYLKTTSEEALLNWDWR